MFNVEPQEKLSSEEVAEFERYVAVQHKKVLRDALWAVSMFVGTCLVVALFLNGHMLHRYWEKIGKYLLLIAMGLFLWAGIKVGFVWSSWQSTRDIRRGFRNADE